VATPYTVLVVEQIDVVRRITKRTSADLRSGRWARSGSSSRNDWAAWRSRDGVIEVAITT
jgi:hypothetical protein